MFALLALVILAAGGGYKAYWNAIGSRYVSTDDAYTAAEVALVTAQVEGPVSQVKVVDSHHVHVGLGVGDLERKAHGDGGINGVATGAEDVAACSTRQRTARGDHAAAAVSHARLARESPRGGNVRIGLAMRHRRHHQHERRDDTMERHAEVQAHGNLGCGGRGVTVT